MAVSTQESELHAISDIDGIPADLLMSMLDAFNDAEEDRQREVVMLRAYYEGDQNVELPERLEEFLGNKHANRPDFAFNILESIITAIIERLRIRNIDCEGDPKQEKWLQNTVFKGLDLDALQEDIHESVLVEGEYFVIVEFIEGELELSLHERYTSLDIDGGTGQGCFMVYPHNDYTKPPMCCVRQWSEYVVEERAFVEQRVIYFQDRSEHYSRDRKAEWHLDETTVYKKDRTGSNIGIPVIHFVNRRLRSEIFTALPIQDLANKSVVDLTTTSDQTAFRIFYALGFIPTTDGEPPEEDGSNWMEVAPGQIVGTTKSRREAAFGAIEPADIKSVLSMVHETILWAAMISQVPLSRFVTTQETFGSDQDDQDGPLLAKVYSRQVIFQKSWRRLFELCRSVWNAYVQGEEAFSEESVITILWNDPELRNEAQRIETLLMKRELAVMFEMLWKEAGYTSEQITRMKGSEEYQRMLAALGPMPGELSEEEIIIEDQENDDVENLDE